MFCVFLRKAFLKCGLALVVNHAHWLRMKIHRQVVNIVRSANFQLVNIGRARKMLTTESTKLAVHTLVTSRLDYCNSLLAGINRALLKRLQNVQRTAARLITRKRSIIPYRMILLNCIGCQWSKGLISRSWSLHIRLSTINHLITSPACFNYGLILGTSAYIFCTSTCSA